jgi:hypothetical protein
MFPSWKGLEKFLTAQIRITKIYESFMLTISSHLSPTLILELLKSMLTSFTVLVQENHMSKRMFEKYQC